MQTGNAGYMGLPPSRARQLLVAGAILVSIQYRLGVFGKNGLRAPATLCSAGFAADGNASLVSNRGYWDQVEVGAVCRRSQASARLLVGSSLRPSKCARIRRRSSAHHGRWRERGLGECNRALGFAAQSRSHRASGRLFGLSDVELGNKRCCARLYAASPQHSRSTAIRDGKSRQATQIAKRKTCCL